MGAYGCVVPIDWPALCEQVLPRWLEVLQRNAVGGFATFAGIDDRIAGYLMPCEVRELADLVEESTSPLGEDDIEDQLFPLFVDRVRRGASDSAGLITVHDGLF